MADVSLMRFIAVLASVIVSFIMLFPRVRQILKVKRWEKSLKLKTHRLKFENLFSTVDGFALSRKARIPQDFTDYIYGEVEFTSWIALLSLAKPQANDVFYDLGSGIGKAVIALSMVFPVKKACGIEILEALHLSACEQKNRLVKQVQYHPLESQIHFIAGDFLKTPFDDATYLFINATTLFEPTWSALCARLDGIDSLRIIITTSKPLKSQYWIPIIKTRVQMSWGIVDAYIHKANLIENIE